MRRYCTVSPYETENANSEGRISSTPSPGGKMELPKTIRREDALLRSKATLFLTAGPGNRVRMEEGEEGRRGSPRRLNIALLTGYCCCCPFLFGTAPHRETKRYGSWNKFEALTPCY
ncbi:hypothetical protein CEXT_317841 [Caerostris extrusa]|uniref:Uncharacterized protein n=1 Tax=Caerostris extrusa TaxID=172846 RepID=A0AAV4X134_CAEEX|nr:hypothetical protein CEXT_317841 [Caerostris extrusa]